MAKASRTASKERSDRETYDWIDVFYICCIGCEIPLGDVAPSRLCGRSSDTYNKNVA